MTPNVEKLKFMTPLLVQGEFKFFIFEFVLPVDIKNGLDV